MALTLAQMQTMLDGFLAGIAAASVRLKMGEGNSSVESQKVLDFQSGIEKTNKMMRDEETRLAGGIKFKAFETI